MEDGLGVVLFSLLIMGGCVVLILVLVEDGLGVCARKVRTEEEGEVLILVLVEDGLGVPYQHQQDHRRSVLILVLVEDGLGDLSGLCNDTEKDTKS